MSEIKFKVNGIPCSVGSEITSDLTLVVYLRNWLELRGTKFMCLEGGCGSCMVVVRVPSGQTFAVNSCLVAVTSCHGWEITTIEGVGSKGVGYHPLQRTLAENNGSQCGYCSPGWVMSMYGLLLNKPNITELEVERSLGSNICRCTGYRPILQGLKKYAKDTIHDIMDIEDLKICDKTGRNCDESNCNDDDWCFIDKDLEEQIELKLKDNKHWYKVFEINDIFKILQNQGDDSYMLVAGNTAKGVYHIDEYPRILIDVSEISGLKGFIIDQNLIVGANTTLTNFMGIMKDLANRNYFDYLATLYKHLEKVAHIPVKNLGTIAGNLMIKHQHNFFPSDIYLLLETVGAQLALVTYNMKTQIVTMEQFLKTNMKGKVIVNILLPPLKKEIELVTYKIMQRSKNAHAIVNGGFLYELSTNNTVIRSRIVFGGLSPSFNRAYKTEKALLGNKLFSNTTLQMALKMLIDELVVVENPPEPSIKYRRELAIKLFYKSLLKIIPPNHLDERCKSGAIDLKEARPVSQGLQIFETNPSLYPLNQPLPKLEALIQCAGEAKYTEDLQFIRNEVYAAFVLSTIGRGRLVSSNAEKALKLPGVLAYYTAKDIPGLNSFVPADAIINIKDEEVLCSGPIKFYNQPVGIIVAETSVIADKAAKLVEVTYSNVEKPVIDVNEAIKCPKRYKVFASHDATNKGTDTTRIIKNSNTIRSQMHFSMENIICICKPTETGMKVYTASQWIDGVQLMFSRALKIHQNCVDVYTRRVGGSYGIKITRSIQSAVACGLVVQKLKRPCRFIQSLTSTTRSVGKRLPCTTSFEAGVNDSGVIQYMNYNLFHDNGFDVNEQFSMMSSEAYKSCYDNARWNFKGYNATTDTAKNTFFRAPGNLECVAMGEFIMEQISYELELDPIEVRLANLDKRKHDIIKSMVNDLKVKSDFDKRKADVCRYNSENRWKKRGLRCSMFTWEPVAVGMFDVNMSVYHGNGTVAITHGGTEMGQGIDTKAAQICAYFLKIPLDRIQIKINDTVIGPNAFQSGGSVTSQNIGVGVQKCCEELLKRLQPIRQQMGDPTWEELIVKAFESNIDLQTHSFVTAKDVSDNMYTVYGVAFSEVEIDVLTGEYQIIRVDIMEDVGRSVNPELDIGQVEDAFVMGIGYWTTEKLVYDCNTGELLTNRTWNYKVPLCEDIPQDFRIYFRENSFSHKAILGSKAVGEPPMCLAVSVALALREAISAARLESGIKGWFSIDGPTTVEVVGLNSEVKIEDLTLNKCDQ